MKSQSAKLFNKLHILPDYKYIQILKCFPRHYKEIFYYRRECVSRDDNWTWAVDWTIKRNNSIIKCILDN